jgi:hypothetical protein
MRYRGHQMLWSLAKQGAPEDGQQQPTVDGFPASTGAAADEGLAKLLVRQ